MESRLSSAVTVIPSDWRSLEERFGVYIIRGGELTLLATCSCSQGVGVAIFTLAQDGEFENIEGFGVLDSFGDPEVTGEWLVNPFTTRKVTI